METKDKTSTFGTNALGFGVNFYRLLLVVWCFGQAAPQIFYIYMAA